MSITSQAQRSEFSDVGFAVFAQLYSPAEMDEIDAAFERLHSLSQQVAAHGGRGDSVVYRGSKFVFAPAASHVRFIAMCGNAEPALMRFGRDPRLLRIAADLLGTQEMDQLINQAHYKRPGTAVQFDWHQDATHRQMGRGLFRDLNGLGSYVQTLLAVDDSSAENGGLEFIPGTGRLGFVAENLEGRIDLSKAVTPHLRRGDVVAFGPYTVHGSKPNLSNTSRRVFINGYAQPGANAHDYGLPGAGTRLRAE